MGEDSQGRIAELSRQLKNVRAQLKRTRSPMEEGTVCEPDLCVKVVMVYVYSGHDLDAAAEFMVSHGRMAMERARIWKRDAVLWSWHIDGHPPLS